MTAAATTSVLVGLPLEPASLDVKLFSSCEQATWLSRAITGDAIAHAALTVGDLLYDLFRLNTTAMEGIDFARVEDLSDLFRLAQFSEELAGMFSAAYSGSLAQLQGYVGERIAAHALLATGADVSFPTASNEPGWDLLVNGEPFQVKCLSSPGGVYEHLARYPDIPVIVNSELAEFFFEEPQVTVLPTLSHHEVAACTSETLEGAGALLDFQIPLITTALGAGRAGLAVIRRHSDLSSALRAASIDATAAMMLAASGKWTAGALLGLTGVVGGWACILIPMAASVGGYRLGRSAADLLKRNLLCRREADKLNDRTCRFASHAAVVLERMISSSLKYGDRVANLASDDSTFSSALRTDWLRRIECEIAKREFYRELLQAAAKEPRRLEPSSRDPRVHANRALWTAAQAGVLPANVHAATRDLMEAVTEFDRALRRWLLR